MITLKSIRGGQQILDAVNGYTSPKLTEKIDIINDNLNAITHVNGSRVYRVSVEDDYIFYHLKSNAKRRYHFPIQYATIIIE